MVFTADALLGWTDFPKGLRVLLLDDDTLSAVEIKSKLEEMDYIVSLFCNENEAFTAISREPESFHIAIVEVSPSNQHGRFKFLEMAKDLPTIMTSNIECLGTTMKCITLGAAEFLQKPLSEDKLRNIWQHVVHKAFNAGGSTISKSLKPIKETVVSILQLQQETNESDSGKLLGTEQSAPARECDHELSTFSDKFPGPSTPQLKQGCRLLDDGDCQDQPNCSMEQERVDLEEESNSVETTCNNSVAESKSVETSVETTCNNSVAETSNSSVAEVNVVVDQSSISREAAIKEEHSVEPSNTGRNLSNQLYNDSTVGSYGNEIENQKKVPISKAGKTSRKKMKVDWTPELHKQFVQAVEQLGIDQAIPSRILELMKVEGLTRHNVASHLQKYRMHRRHIVPKDEDRRWQQPREPMQRVYVQKPIMAYPTYLSTHGFQRSQHCPVWGHPSTHPSGIQMWGHPGFPTWHHHDSWPWKTHPAMQLDAWGCSAMPPSQGPCSIIPQHASGNHSCRPFDNSSNIPKSYFDCHQDEEVIDKVVKEAMSKPWLPLPLGLKPPSIESVLSELHRQGISNIPPHSHR